MILGLGCERHWDFLSPLLFSPFHLQSRKPAVTLWGNLGSFCRGSQTRNWGYWSASHWGLPTSMPVSWWTVSTIAWLTTWPHLHEAPRQYHQLSCSRFLTFRTHIWQQRFIVLSCWSSNVTSMHQEISTVAWVRKILSFLSITITSKTMILIPTLKGHGCNHNVK